MYASAEIRITRGTDPLLCKSNACELLHSFTYFTGFCSYLGCPKRDSVSLSPPPHVGELSNLFLHLQMSCYYSRVPLPCRMYASALRARLRSDQQYRGARRFARDFIGSHLSWTCIRDTQFGLNSPLQPADAFGHGENSRSEKWCLYRCLTLTVLKTRYYHSTDSLSDSLLDPTSNLF